MQLRAASLHLCEYIQFVQVPPDVNAQKNILKVVGIFAIGGAVLMCIYLVLREIFSNKLVTVKDGTLYGKINIIGVIPDFNNTDD